MATITRLQSHPHYRIDNILIDEYGEKIGALGIAIYNALARYADRVTGICYPCIGTIAKKLKLSRTTVKKYLRILLNHCLITISPRMSKEGDPTSNSYMILDPSPAKVACVADSFEALLTPQEGTFQLPRGGSPDDRPPCPSATYPQSPDDSKQSSTLNKKEGTSERLALLPTEKQRTCPHPPSEIAHFSQNIIICNHCFTLLDKNLTIPGIKPASSSPERALPKCDPGFAGEPEAMQPPVGKLMSITGPATPQKPARKSLQIAPEKEKAAGIIPFHWCSSEN